MSYTYTQKFYSEYSAKSKFKIVILKDTLNWRFSETEIVVSDNAY